MPIPEGFHLEFRYSYISHTHDNKLTVIIVTEVVPNY